MLLGGIVAYSNPVKQKLLNVDPAILDEQRGPGEVSKECALAMARGALHNVGVLDVEGQGVGISTTGFLNGGPPGREGEVWIGCCWKFKDSTGSRAKQYWVKNGKGSIDGQEHEEAADQRDQEKLWVVDKALDLLTEVVEELESKAKAGKL
ncbi:hypothetical protein GLOTRDRAFT_109249 [Gloeophyllum trabeum ATCC 11539]|uniref:CinA C-terminal domain-containing protein n=1 Tax=Gloeophyllum trabeum (strain ATCC 11539 / FP-39264 / Madison 617) TaxID=670483 RepID=S7QNB9_GLOTA|nr:uncharacterized protein GLOTRDRAFT_109249 [Gloeophyllum trabeum ATCC 11539]EPQ60993.1 hypothetical protein GLOTRDRAFT_109249 [Gloeophyllum trabeum ATCC 11539]